jgi:gliding motility-associated-like protein
MRYISIVFFLAAYTGNSFAQTADVTEGCFPLTVNFSAPPGSTAYYWNFQDQVTSNEKNPTNIFSKPGIYNVTFQESVNGPIVKTIPIKVFEDPVLLMKVSGGCAPFNAQFTNTSILDTAITVVKYVWVFGDGQSIENVENPTHLYTTPNTYNVSLNIVTQNPSCTRTKAFTNAIEVITPPVALFFTDPSSGSSCDANASFTFTDQSTGIKPLNYLWTFGNGKSSSLKNPEIQNYTAGQYIASLTVSYSNTTGCTSTMSRTISVGSPKPDIIVSDTVCINEPVTVKSTTPGFHTWNFGNGASANYTNRDSALVLFSIAGKQTISMTLTSFDGRCSGTATKDIVVQDIDLKIETDPTFSCKNLSTVKYKAVSSVKNLLYSWFLPDNTTNTTTTAQQVYWTNTDSIYYDRNIKETHTVVLTVTSQSTKCSATSIAIDTLWLPNAIFSPSVSKGCAPVTTKFSDSSWTSPTNPIVNWRWIMGDGTIIDKKDKSPVTYTYNTPGKYLARLLITTQKGCTDTSFAVLVEVGTNVSQQIDFTASKTDVCLNEPVSFSALIPASLSDKISAYHFSSEGDRLSHCFNEAQVTWTYTQEIGPQDVSLSVDYNGCISEVNKIAMVNVKGALAKIDYTAFCSDPLFYTFNSLSKNATLLTWSLGDGTTGNTPAMAHQYLQGGDYVVELVAENPASGCPPTSDHVTVKPRVVEAKIGIDTLICINSFYSFNAGNSLGVDPQCHTGYTWQFPGIDKRPHTSDQASSRFSFLEPGMHKVLLIAKDVNGCTDTAAATFKVYKMTLKFTTNDTDNKICIPALVQFTDQSVGDTVLTKWSWQFGDRSSSTLRNPTHNYVQAPSFGATRYDVFLKVTDALGCMDSLIFPLAYYKPVSRITASPSPNLCLGKPVTLKADDYTSTGAHLTYLWDLGNGKKDSADIITIVYDSARSYNVVLQYKETGSNCQDDTVLTIRVQDYPIAGISTNVDSLPVLCAPQNVFFKDASKSNFPLTNLWNFGNGQTSPAKEFSLFYSKGTYVARNIVSTSFGCSDTATRSFRVFRPEGTFTMDKDIICKGEIITFSIHDTVDVGSFTWAFGDGNTDMNVSPISHRYNFHPPSGQTLAKLILRGVQGICPVEVQKPVNIRQVIAEFDRNNGGDTSICFNDGPYPLTDKSINIQNYLWNFGDGKTSTVANPVQHAYDAPGVYNVTLSGSENTTGCKDTIVKQIIIYKNPVLIATGDTVCQGKTVQLSVINPDTTSKFQWTPSDGLANTTLTNPVASILHTIIYQVVQTDTNGCTATQAVPAVVIEPSNLHDWDTTLIIGDSAMLPVYGQNVYKFQWTPPTGLSCLQCNYPWARPLADTTYHLKVTDVRNCFTSEYDFIIKIKPETFVKLPTTFTPNDDHHNDSIYVQGWGIKALIEFQIFNRWGQMIFVSNNMKLGWDGKFNGILQNSDVYVYKVKVLTWREEILYNEGYINLIH